jgi:Glucodextranase, domain B
MLRALARAWLLVTGCLLLVTGSAQAAITDSTITTPTDPSFFIYDTTSPGTIAVTGSVTGTGDVDLRCYMGATSVLVTAGITPSAGAFTANPSRSAFPAQTCVLRAVTTTTTPVAPPGSPSPFAGPTIGAGNFQPRVVASGPNTGQLYDFFLRLPQLKAQDQFLSVSGCGQSQGTLLDPATLAQLPNLWACMNYLWYQDRQNGGETRSEVQVDGVNHYLGYGPANFFAGSDQLAGLPQLTADYTQDPVSGDLKLTEHAGTVACATNTYPPASGTCGSFSPGAIAVDRTTTVDHQGVVTRITTTVRDVSHQAHHLDLQFEQDQDQPGSFQFPGESAFSTHVDGDVVTFPASSGPATILVKRVSAASDGDDGEPKGSITLMPAPAAARFYDPRYYHLDYQLDIPADGSATFDAVYAISATLDGAQGFAAEARDRIGTPVVTINSPAEGSTVAAAAQTITGTAVDAGGAVTSLTVNGQAVAVGADGGWSAPLTLASGANEIVAVAADAFGNKGSATRHVTFTAPIPAGPTPSAKDTTPPNLTSLSMSARRFAVAVAPTPVALAAVTRGTIVRWTVSEAGTTRFAIKRLVPGRRKGSRCITGKSAPRRGRRCTRVVAAGTLRRTGAAGKRSLKFSGRIGRRALARGRYRMDVTATDAVGNRSAARSLTFTVIRAKH